MSAPLRTTQSGGAPRAPAGHELMENSALPTCLQSRELPATMLVRPFVDLSTSASTTPAGSIKKTADARC
jgi:hypothetical protein